jgi:saccharopine dehydrogenase-like NADP-dependent oxidoreductase
MKVNIEDALLIAGGYGVVGQQTAQVIRQRHPALPLLIAGRNPAKGEPLVHELTNADTVKLDVEQPNPLKGIKPRAILAIVNDPHNHLLMDAVRGRIPYLDITRWTERLQAAVSRLSAESVTQPMNRAFTKCS